MCLNTSLLLSLPGVGILIYCLLLALALVKIMPRSRWEALVVFSGANPHLDDPGYVCRK